MKGAYYNEWDQYCAQWLRNLMAANLIAAGDVDERSIKDVRADDLKGYVQHHFFAGIGGWSAALRLAGWADERPVWTGSCPCQPFSVIGKGLGMSDERHLWPVFYNLIAQCMPPVLFGEQVPTALVWLDLVFADLEKSGYACAAADIPAASKGARHLRQRLWFVADADTSGWPYVKGQSTAKTQGNVGATTGVVHSLAIEPIRGTFEPDDSWIVDGLYGEGNAVSAYGNAIVPQVAAEFIRAYMEVRP